MAVNESSGVIDKGGNKDKQGCKRKKPVNMVISRFLDMSDFGVEMGSGASAAEVLVLLNISDGEFIRFIITRTKQ